MFKKEKWFDAKTLELSVDALDALTWYKSDEYCYDLADLNADEEVEETELPATNAVPF